MASSYGTARQEMPQLLAGNTLLLLVLVLPLFLPPALLTSLLSGVRLFFGFMDDTRQNSKR